MTSGQPTELMRFPDRETDIGRLISAYLEKASEIDDRAVHLLFSANRWEKRQAIIDALTRGHNVVMDRYAYSGVAFSAGENVYRVAAILTAVLLALLVHHAAKSLDRQWCMNPDAGGQRF